jgi:hypothetical protein
MSKGRILKMALDEIVGGVKKVDLGDLTKKVNVGDRVEAVKRMLGDAGGKVVEKADDWGWKGGKPGEVTAENFSSTFLSPLSRSRALDMANKKAKDIRKLAAKNPEHPAVQALEKAKRQGGNSPMSLQIAGNPSVGLDTVAGTKLMDIFESAQVNNIPRKYTSRVANLLTEDWTGYLGNRMRPPDTRGASDLAQSLRRLNDKQRDLFFDIADATTPSGGALFGNIEVASRAASELPNEVVPVFMQTIRSGYNFADAERAGKAAADFTDDQRETFLSLLPEWSGSLDELVEAARSL